ncbi:hypothetical protein [Lactococcus lactis]|uniref:hypothetical protein n=1 Tax=Lactococcus lactis TaxID=1358 RepID=UPI0002DD3965|nr:hypothetical protein [Lactococcus lactis]MCO0817273.1 hypothetical protein [Lactococcus lactis]
MNCLITDFLEKLKNYLEKIVDLDKNKYLKSTSSYNGFEKLIIDSKDDFLLTGDFQYNVIIEPNFGHHFPDLDIFIDGVKYGVELKSRKDGSWVNNGGSVFESQTSQGYKEIYIFFGTYNEKQGDTSYKIKYRPHWEVAENVSVTHSPRYFYNMNATTSLFTSSEQYLSLRDSREDIEKFVQQVLRSSANGPKWYLSSDEDNQVNPILITTLNDDIQIKVYSEIAVLYPQDLFSNTRTKFNRAAAFMMNSYFYYSSSLRDSFSAGGKWTPEFYPEIYQNTKVFPHIIKNLKRWSNEIENVCRIQSDDFKEKAYESWKSLDITFEKIDFLADYKKVIDHLGEKIFKEEILKSNKKGLRLSEIIF